MMCARRLAGARRPASSTGSPHRPEPRPGRLGARLSGLLPALALLLGALGLFAAAPANAQTTVWSATLTVKQQGAQSFGCVGTGAQKCSDALSDNDLSHGSTDYTVNSLYRYGSSSGGLSQPLYLSFNKAPPVDLTLHVGTDQFPFWGARFLSGNVLAWPSAGQTWAAGATVQVSLKQSAGAGLSVTQGNAKLDLSWTAPAGTVTGYDVHYTSASVDTAANDAAVGNNVATGWVAVSSRTSTDTTASQSITGLTNSTPYRVRVRGKYANGNGPWVFGTGTPQALAAPTGLSVTPGNMKLDLSWTAPSGTLTGYDVEYKKRFGAAEWADAGHSGTTPSLTISSLDNGVLYDLRVRAKNGAVDGPWATVQAGPAASSTPVVGFAEAAYEVTEGFDPSVTITLTMVPPLAAAGTATVSALTGDAAHTAGALDSGNYTLPASVALPAGVHTATFAVAIPDDELAETAKTLVLGLDAPAAGQAWARAADRPSARVRILDDDVVTVSFFPNQYTVQEGVAALLRFRLDRAADFDFTVEFYGAADTDPSTADATPGADYVIEGSPVTFRAGETALAGTSLRRVQTLHDRLRSEGDEYLHVRMRRVSAPDGARVQIGPDPATVIIFPNSASVWGVAAAAGDAKLEVTWEAPDGTVTGYDVHYTSSGVWVGADALAGSNPSAAAGWVAVDRGTEADPPNGWQAITGLTNSTPYRVRVRAQALDETNFPITGSWIVATGTPQAGQVAGPSTPRGVTAASGGAKLTLAWQAPAFWGSWPADGFEVQWKLPSAGSGAWADVRQGAQAAVAAFASTATGFEFTGIQRDADGRVYTVVGGTGYDLRVRAVSKQSGADGSQDSHYRRSAWVGVSGTPVPGAPARLGVSAGAATLSLSWAPPWGTLTGYDVHYTSSKTVPDDAAAGANAATAWKAVSRGSETSPPAVSQTISSLNNGTAYRVRVRARNAHGAGAWVFGRGTPGAAATGTPAAPTNLNVLKLNTALRLSWTAPSGTLTGYDVHYTSSTTAADTATAQTGGDAAGWVAVDRGTEADPPTPWQTISSLTNDQEYRVRARAKNANGAGAWMFGTGTPVATAAPRDLVVTPGDAELTVTWIPGASISSYELHFTSATMDAVADDAPSGTDPSVAWVETLTLPSSGATSHTITSRDATLVNGTPYRVRLRGIGPDTAWIYGTGTPLAVPGAPTGLGVTAGSAMLSLSWTAPAGPVTGYDVHYTAADEDTVADDAAAGANAATGWAAVSRGAETNPPTASQTISGLTNDREYRVRVRARNASGPGAWVFDAGTPADLPAGTLWSATFTPPSLGYPSIGCRTKAACDAALSDNSFTVGGTEFGFIYIEYSSFGPTLTVSVTPAPTGAAGAEVLQRVGRDTDDP